MAFVGLLLLLGHALATDPGIAATAAHSAGSATAPAPLTVAHEGAGEGALPASGGEAVEDREGHADPIDLTVGERLVYRGTVRKAGVTVDAGRATFAVARDDEGRVTLTARARGEKFGYSLDTSVTTTLSADLTRPAVYHYRQSGSEKREKKVTFGERVADYILEKHCMEPDCQDRAHFVLRQGGMFSEDEWVHCYDRDCRIPAHRHWKHRRHFDLSERHFDVLSAVYYARTLGLAPGSEPIEVPVITDWDRWRVRVQAREGGKIRVKAGTFDTFKLTLDPVPEEGTEADEEFKGLFGLNGTIHIWVDKATSRPVLVQGKLPFAFMDLHARVELESVVIAPDPVAPSGESGTASR
ncbi:MAG: DUF3108 domain-containing protein [Planctomycetes bacterium]|nr:DUF3108 domain-containing protein [Planctomycetota bacterium]